MAASENLLHVAVEPAGRRSTLVISGEIDLLTAAPLRSTIDEVLDGGATFLDFDLSSVSFMDSTGLGILANASDRASAVGGSVRVIGASPTVVRLLAVSRLDSVIEVA